MQDEKPDPSPLINIYLLPGSPHLFTAAHKIQFEKDRIRQIVRVRKAETLQRRLSSQLPVTVNCFICIEKCGRFTLDRSLMLLRDELVIDKQLNVRTVETSNIRERRQRCRVTDRTADRRQLAVGFLHLIESRIVFSDRTCPHCPPLIHIEDLERREFRLVDYVCLRLRPTHKKESDTVLDSCFKRSVCFPAGSIPNDKVKREILLENLPDVQITAFQIDVHPAYTAV